MDKVTCVLLDNAIASSGYLYLYAKEVLTVPVQSHKRRLSLKEFHGSHAWNRCHFIMFAIANKVTHNLVHVGFALSIIDEAEANRIFDYLDKIGDLDELHVKERRDE